MKIMLPLMKIINGSLCKLRLQNVSLMLERGFENRMGNSSYNVTLITLSMDRLQAYSIVRLCHYRIKPIN